MAQVQSLVWGLTSHKPFGTAKKEKRKKNRVPFVSSEAGPESQLSVSWPRLQLCTCRCRAACTECQRHPLDQSARRGLSISTPSYRSPRQEQHSWVTRPDGMAALQVTSRQPIPEVTTKLRCWNHTVCVEKRKESLEQRE